MKFEFLIVILMIIPTSFEASFKPASKLIYDFVMEKQIHAATIFVCWEMKHLISFSQRLMRKRISVNMMNRFDVPLDNIFQEKYITNEAIILDTDCSGTKTLIENASSRLFDITHTWLILDSSTDILMILRNASLNFNTAITLARPIVEGKIYSLHEIYNPSYQHGGQMKINLLGTWSFGYKFSWSKYGQEHWIERRRNMSGVLLQARAVVTEHEAKSYADLLNYLGSYDVHEHDPLTRCSYKLMVPLQQYLTLAINYTPTKSWGYKQDDGSFDGAIGSMNQGEADLSITPTQYNIPRSPHIFPVVNIFDYKQKIIFRHPEDAGLSVTTAFFKPFTIAAWLAAAICAFVMLLLLRFTATYDFVSQDRTWSSDFLLLIGAFSQQGTEWSPRKASGRILLLYMLIFTMLFYQFYSAILVSTLLMDPPRTITDVDSLIKSNLQVDIEDIIILHNYFRVIDYGPGLKIWKAKLEFKKDRTFLKPILGVKKVQEGGMAYICDIAKAHMIIKRTFTDKQICDIQEIHLMDPWPMYVILQKHSTFKKIFRVGLGKMVESGVLNRERRIWDAKKPECAATRSGDDIHVNMDQAAMPFLILAAGHVISICILILEKLFHLRSIYRKIGVDHKTSKRNKRK